MRLLKTSPCSISAEESGGRTSLGEMPCILMVGQQLLLQLLGDQPSCGSPASCCSINKSTRAAATTGPDQIAKHGAWHGAMYGAYQAQELSGQFHEFLQTEKPALIAGHSGAHHRHYLPLDLARLPSVHDAPQPPGGLGQGAGKCISMLTSRASKLRMQANCAALIKG